MSRRKGLFRCPVSYGLRKEDFHLNTDDQLSYLHVFQITVGFSCEFSVWVLYLEGDLSVITHPVLQDVQTNKPYTQAYKSNSPHEGLGLVCPLLLQATACSTSVLRT